MSSHTDHNEGIRILEEFVCQAIPDPSVYPGSSQPPSTGTEQEEGDRGQAG